PANLVTTDKHLVVPYTQSMNLTIERQIRSDLAFEVSYVGKLSQKLEGHRHWNPAVYGPNPVNGQAPSAQNVNDRVLYPQTRGLFNTQSRYLGNDYRSGYHAAQFRVDRRFSRGLSLLGSYSLSKGIDDVTAPQPGLTPGVSNPFNLLLDKGRGNFDRRHVVSVSWLYGPDVRFRNAAAKELLEHWRLGGQLRPDYPRQLRPRDPGSAETSLVENLYMKRHLSVLTLAMALGAGYAHAQQTRREITKASPGDSKPNNASVPEVYAIPGQ